MADGKDGGVWVAGILTRCCTSDRSMFSTTPIALMADGKVVRVGHLHLLSSQVGGVRVSRDPDALRHQRRVAEDHVVMVNTIQVRDPHHCDQGLIWTFKTFLFSSRAAHAVVMIYTIIGAFKVL
jgi:hypothetical protein